MWPSTDELVRILEAGVNVVTTAAFINGSGNLADRERILGACEQGGSTIFGTGISPGFVELIGIATANICDRIDKITIDEGSDTTLYDSPATELPCGFGRPMDDPELPGMAAEGTAVFGEAVALVADALGIELDDIVCEAEYARTTEDVVMDSWTIPAGHVAGVVRQLAGSGRRPHRRSSCNVRWRKGQTLDPDWPIKEGHVIQVDGRPTVTVTLEYLPPPDFEATTFADFMVLGMIMTAMPAINAIPHVVAAPPGIVDLHRPAAALASGASSRADPRRQSVRPSSDDRSSAAIVRSTNAMVVSWPAVTPSESSRASTWERPVISSRATIGGSWSSVMPWRASAARIASTCAARNRSA